MRQVAAHECGAVRFVAAHPERFAVRVVESGVERAGDDQRAQLRDRYCQSRGFARDRLAARRYDGSRVRNKSIGCPCSSHAAVSEAHESGERAHRAEARVLVGCGEGPRVPERHRPESPRLASGTGPDPAIDVEDRDAIDGSSAELIRRPILELLEPMLHIDDADVVRPWRGDVRTFPERDRDRGSQEGASREGVGGRPAHRANYARATGQYLSATADSQSSPQSRLPRPSAGAREARALTGLGQARTPSVRRTDPADR